MSVLPFPGASSTPATDEPATAAITIKPGSQCISVHCSACAGEVGVFIVPPMPEMPLALHSLLKPIVNYFARKSPAAREFCEAAFRGDFRTALAIATEESGPLPALCAPCANRLLEQLKVAGLIAAPALPAEIS